MVDYPWKLVRVRRLTGLDPATPFTEGNDLFAAAPTRPAKPAVYSETFRGRKPRSFRTSSHHLIHNADDETWEFYRLEEDPKGMHDRYGDASRRDGTLLAELKAELLEQIAPKEHALKGESVELDDATIEQLKELGFLQ